MNGKLLYWIMGVLVTIVLLFEGAWMNDINKKLNDINERSILGYQRLATVEESLKRYTREDQLLHEEVNEIKDYLKRKGWMPRKDGNQ